MLRTAPPGCADGRYVPRPSADGVAPELAADGNARNELAEIGSLMMA